MGTALVESVRSDPFNGYVLKSVCLESKKIGMPAEHSDFF